MRKYIVYINLNIFFLIFNSFCFSQNIDSLKLALKIAKHDTTRCNILNAMIEAEGDDEIWPKYNEQLKALAEKNLANNTTPKNFYLKQLGSTLNNMGYFYQQQDNIPKAIESYLKGLKILQDINDKNIRAAILHNLGSVYDGQGDMQKALEYHHKDFNLREEIGDKSGMAVSLNDMALIYYHQGDIPKSLEYHHRSLKINEELGDKKAVARCLNNVAVIYEAQGDHTNALVYFQKSLKFRKEIGDKRGIANSLNNIGGAYKKQGDALKAIQFIEMSKKIYEVIGDKSGVASGYNNLGTLYKDQGNISKALDYYHKGLMIREEIGEKIGIARSLNNISDLMVEKGDLNAGFLYANRAMQTSKELGFPDNIEFSAHILKNIYQKQNKYKDAFDMYELEIKMRDSINNQETRKESVKKQMQYTYEKKELETKAEQDKKDAIANEEKQKQKVITYSVSIGLFLVLLLTLFIFRGLRQKQKANLIITQQKIEVESQKHYIEEKHKEITDSINYAERIQRSFIATKEILDENLNDYFVYFKPKDVVSGDFYWSGKLNNGNFAFVTADSTGHGVPGAIMSLLNITSLEKAIESLTEPAEILNATRNTIIERLKKDGSEHGGKDGMDASLTIYDFKTKKLYIAAANNPVWIVRSTSSNVGVNEVELIEIKPDKMPVGKHDRDNVSFTQQQIQLQSGDIVYTLTDGFPDQFGGEKGKKYMSKNLKELLLTNAHLAMHEQKQLLEKTFTHWKNNLEQVDDVTVIGIKI